MGEIKWITQLMNEILKYLGTRPFIEVAGLIHAVQKEVEKDANPPVDFEQ